MALNRLFVGWDGPLVRKAAGEILGRCSGRTADVGGLLIVVPTKEAGRKLRETMARICASRGGGLLSARFVTPPFFIMPEAVPEGIAGRALVKSVWCDLLTRADLKEYPVLFPVDVPKGERRAWALGTGEALERLRNTLLDSGLTVSDVCTRAEEQFEESGRWQDLLRLENLYLRDMARHGLTDRVSFAKDYVANPEPPRGIERIVVAGCPDPQPLAMMAIERLGRTMDIDILVHGPEELRDHFDGWGRPRTEKWEKRNLDIPGSEEGIRVAETPSAQAALAVRIATDEAVRASGGKVGIASADPDVTPCLRRELERTGAKAFDPAGRSLRDHPLYALLRAFADFAYDHSYESLSKLLRQGPVLEDLDRSVGVDPERALAEMDALQNAYLPRRFGDLTAALERGHLPRGLGPVTNAARALRHCEGLAADFRRLGFAEGVRQFLRTVYRGKKLRPLRGGDGEFLQAAGKVDEALREMESLPAGLPGGGGRVRFDIFMKILGEGKTDSERERDAVDIEGWLELQWNDSPLLVVAGFNEGRVPEGWAADSYLPDSFRHRLGLRNNADRTARDAYIAQTLVESRRTRGQVFFIAGRRGLEGDPLLPSRLLFAVGPDRAVDRARRLFSSVPERLNRPAAVPCPILDARAVEQALPDALQVTSFREYILCPFRFYLRRVLSMETVDDRKEELDARDYGEAVHFALQGLASGRWTAERDEEELKALLRRRCDQWVGRRFGRSVPPVVAIQATSMKRRLDGAAALQGRLAAAGWEIVAAEVPVEEQRSGRLIKGRIDRIDRHRETGAFRVIDYKTTDRGRSPEETHVGPARRDGCYRAPDRGGRKRSWTDLQMPLYLAMAQGAGIVTAGAVAGIFHLPAGDGETALTLWENYGSEARRSAHECADSVIERISGGVFWPPAAKVPWDDLGTLFGGDPDRLFVTPPSVAQGEGES